MHNVTASLTRLPELFLQDFQPLNAEKSSFRINATFANHAAPDNKELASMFATTVDNKLAVIAGSVDIVGSNANSKIVSFLAQGNVINRPLTGIEGRMTCVAANVFLDNEDESLWTMHGEGENRRLVQASKEDWSALLHSRLARRNGTMVTASSYTPFHHGIKPDVFDFAMYYSPVNQSIDYGFALPVSDGSVLVASMNNNGNLEKVSPLAVIDTAVLANTEGLVPARIEAQMRQAINILAGSGLPMSSEPVLEPNTDDFTEPMANTFLTYMGSLYKGTTFFSELSKLIANRRRISSENEPLTTMRMV